MDRNHSNLKTNGTKEMKQLFNHTRRPAPAGKNAIRFRARLPLNHTKLENELNNPANATR